MDKLTDKAYSRARAALDKAYYDSLYDTFKYLFDKTNTALDVSERQFIFSSAIVKKKYDVYKRMLTDIDYIFKEDINNEHNEKTYDE